MFKPFHCFATVKLDPKPTKTAGGIDIPEVSEATFRTGVVLAVGPGLQAQDGTYPGLPVKPGERVVIATQRDRVGNVANLATVDVDDESVVIVNYQDIWGTCEKAAGSHGPQLAIAKA